MGELGTWDTEKEGRRGRVGEICELHKSVNLFASLLPQTNPPSDQDGPLSSGQWQKNLTWGLSRASSSIFCHISSLSFIRNRPLKEQRQDGG